MTPNVTPAITAGILALLTLLSACSSDDAVSASDSTTLVSTPVGAGWTLELPEDWVVNGRFGEPTQAEPGCVIDRISISNGIANTLVMRVGSGCSASAIGRGNGRLPTLGSAAQLLDGGTDVVSSDTPLGSLTLATVDYFECDSECTSYEPEVALIELEQPSDPTFPAIAISDDGATMSRTEIEFIARHLTRPQTADGPATAARARYELSKSARTFTFSMGVSLLLT